MPDYALHFQLLGKFIVRVNGLAIPDEQWRSRRARNLVKLLALASAHRLHRDQVLDALWPDSDLTASANNFHQTLFTARKVFENAGSTCLVLQDSFLSFGELIEVDVDAFEEAAALATKSRQPQDYQAALECYSGDLLPENLYDEWTLPRRDALRLLHLKLLLELSQVYADLHEYPLGIETLQRVIAADRTNEAAHAALMRLYALSGQRQQALRQFGLLSDALRIELEMQPGPATQRLYEQIQAGKLEQAPELASLPAARAHSLPAQLSSFIGREIEMGDVQRLVQAHRLVTLTGSGGTGKTRLALQTAEAVVSSFANGAFLVELAPITDPDLIPNACLQTLELISQPGVPPAKVLAGYLEKKHLLLILDNCEHLTPACTRLADELLKSCPRLHILATSREILSIPGETPYRVPSLAVPSRSDLEGEVDLASFDAVRLFVERAGEAQPGFDLTRENAPAVVEICARLDGIPLAIELAAARARVMSAAQIAARLDNAFRLLTGGSQAVMPRQQTLRATIDWSYALITPLEKTLLQRLAVFSGGWSLEACEGVCAEEAGLEGCAGEALREGEVLDLLTRLVDRSLVIADVRPGGTRYRMLETIRQYAREKLLESGCGEQARGRHLAYFARLSGEAAPHLRGKGQVEWLDRLELELDNLRAALEWSRAANIELGLKIASDMMWFWEIRALFEEAVAQLEKLLAAETARRGAGPFEGERALQRARALRTFAWHLSYTNHSLAAQIQSFLGESVAILRGLGPAAQSELGISLFDFWWKQGWMEENLDQSTLIRAEFLELFERARNRFYLSEYYFVQHQITARRGRLEEAEAFNEESLAICREIGDLDGIMSRCHNLSFYAWYKGDHVRADALLKEALAACRKVRNRWFEPSIRNELSIRALSRGEYPQAVRLAEESLLEFRDLKYLSGIASTLDVLQRIAWSRGDLDESLRRGWERLDLYARQLFSTVTEFMQHNPYLNLGRVAISQGDLGQAEQLLKTSTAYFAWREGEIDYFLEIHLLLAWIALLTQQSKQSAAARLLGAVDSFYRQTAPSFSPRERSEHLENLASVQTALGQEAFSALFAEGQALSLAEAIAFVNNNQ